MSDAISAQGTLIARSPDPNWPPTAPQGGAVTFTTIAELRDITPPPLTRNPIETTNHNEEEENFVVGIRRKGEMTFTLGYVPSLATHDHITGLTKAWVDGSRDIYRITYPDGTQWMFSGYVTNIGPSAPVDDGLTADLTIRPTNVMAFVEPV